MWFYCPQPIKLAVLNIWKVLFGWHVTSTRVWNKNLWFQADHGKIKVRKSVWFVWCHNMVRLWSAWSGNPGSLNVVIFLLNIFDDVGLKWLHCVHWLIVSTVSLLVLYYFSLNRNLMVNYIGSRSLLKIGSSIYLGLSSVITEERELLTHQEPWKIKQGFSCGTTSWTIQTLRTPVTTTNCVWTADQLIAAVLEVRLGRANKSNHLLQTFSYIWQFAESF